MWILVSLSPQAQSDPVAQEQELLLTKADVASATAEREPNLPAAKTNPELLIWHHSSGGLGSKLITLH